MQSGSKAGESSGLNFDCNGGLNTSSFCLNMLLLSEKIKNKIKVIRNDIDYINEWLMTLFEMNEQESILIDQKSFEKIYSYLHRIEKNLDYTHIDQLEELRNTVNSFKHFILSYSITLKNQKNQNLNEEYLLLKKILIERMNELVELFY